MGSQQAFNRFSGVFGVTKTARFDWSLLDKKKNKKKKQTKKKTENVAQLQQRKKCSCTGSFAMLTSAFLSLHFTKKIAWRLSKQSYGIGLFLLI